MSTAAEDLLKETLGRLRSLLGRIPASYGDWSYDRSVAFKAAHNEASKVCSAPRPSLARTTQALSSLNSFFSPSEQA